MSKREGTLYARLGLQLVHHYRAREAGEHAMGLYAFLVMYSRLEELDGFVPEPVAVHGWSGDGKGNRRALRKLAEAGLISASPDGILVLKFDEFNETKAQIFARRSAWKAKKRGQRIPVVPEDTQGTPPVCPPVVPVFASGVVSGSDLRKSGSEIQAGKAEPSPEAPSETKLRAVEPARVLHAGTFGAALHSWADGMESVTGGRPDTPPWAFDVMEKIAQRRPAEAVDALAWAFADGAAWATRERAEHGGKYPLTFKRYRDWVGSGRPPAPTQSARGRPLQPVPAEGRAWKMPKDFDVNDPTTWGETGTDDDHR